MPFEQNGECHKTFETIHVLKSFYFSFKLRSITNLILVTDLHFYVYPHGPYSLLEF